MNAFIPGNKLTLLKNGAEYFPALETAFNLAQREIYVETYIFRADAIGQCIAAALCLAARRGVATHVVLDGFGSQDLPRSFVKEMEASGVKVRFYRPFSLSLTLRTHRLRRLHRKLVCVDNSIAFVGGINIQDDFDVPGVSDPRIDFAVAVEGPLLAEIHKTMLRLWSMLEWLQQKRRPRLTRLPETAIPSRGAIQARLVIRDNLRHRRDIEAFYLDGINNARQEVIIANAYFLPGYQFRHALIAAVQRGVKVILLLQGRVEYFFLHYATRTLYGNLLAAGIEIHEYQKSFLHAKVAVFDERIVTVGSSNIDPFSLVLAREANIVADDAGFARELRASLNTLRDEGCSKISEAHLKKEAWPMRIIAWLSFAGVRLLTGLTGYAFDEKR